jgi:DNA polymerase-3 subunit chi
MPEGFDVFDRVIEVVSVDEEDRATARLRWKQYVQQGYAIQRHDLKLKGAE